MNEGWKCPGCYLIHAPFVKSCSCQQTLQHAIETNAQAAEEFVAQAADKALRDTLSYGVGAIKVEHVPIDKAYLGAGGGGGAGYSQYSIDTNAVLQRMNDPNCG